MADKFYPEPNGPTCSSEDELLNVQHPIYDAEPLNCSSQYELLQDDLYSVETKVDAIAEVLRRVLHIGVPPEEASQIIGDKKSRKALGIKPPKPPKDTPVTIVFDHPSITINLIDGQAQKGDKK